MPTSKDSIKKYLQPWTCLTDKQLKFMGPSNWTFKLFSNWDDWPSIDDYQLVWQRHYQKAQLCFTEQKLLGQRSLRKLKAQLRLQGKTPLDNYVESIALNHHVPTRQKNWHDFFNFNIWLSFPSSKWALHNNFYTSRQTGLNKQSSKVRSQIEDLLTSFDEGGAVLACLDKDLAEVKTLLKGRCIPSKEVLVNKPNIEFTVFGHGVIESILAGQPLLNLMTIPIKVSQNYFTSDPSKRTKILDSKLARIIEKNELTIAGSFPLTGNSRRDS